MHQSPLHAATTSQLPLDRNSRYGPVVTAVSKMRAMRRAGPIDRAVDVKCLNMKFSHCQSTSPRKHCCRRRRRRRGRPCEPSCHGQTKPSAHTPRRDRAPQPRLPRQDLPRPFVPKRGSTDLGNLDPCCGPCCLKGNTMVLVLKRGKGR